MMPDIHRAADVHEAVALASTFKRDGGYNWFRGQLQNWPLRSSIARLAQGELEEAREKVGRFWHWAKTTPGLESLGANIAAFWAVAQHYGLPTNYIDFTTNPEIAGFFAADNPKGRSLDAESCIMCLETSDLKTFWKGMPSKYPPPEFIEMEVSNLWRLEAQEGCFLYCAYGNFEHIYDLDRIVFPYGGPFSGIPRSNIYPLEKSGLEIALDQYFMNEKMIAVTQMAHSIFGSWMDNGMTLEDTGGWNSDLVSTPIPADSSWDKNVVTRWTQDVPERYSHVSTGPTLTLSFFDQAGL